MISNYVRVLASFLLLAVILSGQTLSTSVLQYEHEPDDAVSAVVAADQVGYLGGAFSRFQLASGGAVLTDSLTGQVATVPFPRVDGSVLAVLPDGVGGWFIGGEFDDVGGVPRTGLARVRADGALDPAWNPILEGTAKAVWDMKLQGTTLYIAGTFEVMSGVPRRNIAALDAATGAVLTFDPGAIASTGVGRVAAIDVLASTLYAVGAFDSVQGQPRSGHAAFDVSTGALLSWNRPAGAFVRDLVASSFGVFLGGSSLGPLVCVDPITAAPVAGWLGFSDGSVDVLYLDGAILYVGGEFSRLNGLPSWKVGALDAGTGQLLSWNPGIVGTSSRVTAITRLGETIYLGGHFIDTGGGAQPALAGFDRTSGALTSWAPEVSPLGTCLCPKVEVLAGQAKTVFVGGLFERAGGVTRNRLAAIDLTTGRVTDWDPNCNAKVFTMFLDGDTLWIGGSFSQVAGQTRLRVAALDRATGTALPFTSPSINGIVADLAVHGGTVYIAGSFTNVGGQSRNRLAALDAMTGALLPWDPQVDGPVDALEIGAAGTVYVGGSFGLVRGVSRPWLAALDPIDGAPLAWAPTPNATVRAITHDPVAGTVLVGGDFTLINGQSRSKLAELDVSGCLTPFAAGLPIGAGSVTTMLLDDHRVYVASLSSFVNPSLRELDRTTGMPSPWVSGLIGLSPGVDDLTLAGPRLVAVGGFGAIGQQSRNYIGAYAFSEYASVEGVAGPCSVTISAPHLESSIPRLGSVHAYGITTSLPSASGALFISLTPLPGALAEELLGCPIFLDLPSLALLASFHTDMAGTAAVGIPLPNDPTLALLPPLRVAAVVASPGGALGQVFDVSNTLSITLGY